MSTTNFSTSQHFGGIPSTSVPALFQALSNARRELTNFGTLKNTKGYPFALESCRVPFKYLRSEAQRLQIQCPKNSNDDVLLGKLFHPLTRLFDALDMVGLSREQMEAGVDSDVLILEGVLRDFGISVGVE